MAHKRASGICFLLGGNSEEIIPHNLSCRAQIRTSSSDNPYLQKDKSFKIRIISKPFKCIIQSKGVVVLLRRVYGKSQIKRFNEMSTQGVLPVQLAP